MHQSGKTTLDTLQLQDLWHKLYTKNGKAWLTVSSGSMAPMIQVGDKVLVKQTAPQHIRFGDIIVFKEAGKLITHRVIGKQVSDRHVIFMQKGDSNTSATYVLSENVIGKVVCIGKEDKIIRLDSFLGRQMNLLLSFSFYVLYILHKRHFALRLDRLFRYCLNILFLVRFWINI